MTEQNTDETKLEVQETPEPVNEPAKRGRKPAALKDETQFVTAEDLKASMEGVTNSVKNMLEGFAESLKPQTAVEKKETEEVKAAGAVATYNDPRYEAKAKFILGDHMDRCFLTYPVGGGTLFNIVIKKEKSNAPADYLERMKEDIRTVNIEREDFRGEEGVARYSKLVLQNLTRNKN